MLGGLALAQIKPFSHKLHLQLKLDCISCHSTIASSAKAQDNNLPAQQICRRCHEKDLPVKRPAKLLVSSFSHAFHLKMGNLAPVIAAAVDSKRYHLSTRGLPPPPTLRPTLNTKNACAACHRGIEGNESVSNELFPNMQDCLVCHTKIDPPFSCEKCHTPGPHLKPADHTPTYVDIHSTSRANLNKPACVVCHDKRFTCLGCH